MAGGRTLAVAAAWMAGVAVLSASVAVIQVTPVVADGHVTASFVAPTSFGRDTQDIVQSGLLLTFTFDLELRRPSNVWLDRTLGTATVASTVRYDNLTSVYQVSKLDAGRVFWSERTQDAAQVRTWMTSFTRVSLVAREPLEPNVDYYVRVRMQATPRRAFSLWPWSGDAASGRADFTFIR